MGALFKTWYITDYPHKSIDPKDADEIKRHKTHEYEMDIISGLPKGHNFTWFIVDPLPYPI